MVGQSFSAVSAENAVSTMRMEIIFQIFQSLFQTNMVWPGSQGLIGMKAPGIRRVMCGQDWYGTLLRFSTCFPQALGFENGSIQVMSDVGDCQPALFQTGLTAPKASSNLSYISTFFKTFMLFQIRWNISGSILAVAGEEIHSTNIICQTFSSCSPFSVKAPKLILLVVR
jgi:hypothetical protein